MIDKSANHRVDRASFTDRAEVVATLLLDGFLSFRPREASTENCRKERGKGQKRNGEYRVSRPRFSSARRPPCTNARAHTRARG